MSSRNLPVMIAVTVVAVFFAVDLAAEDRQTYEIKLLTSTTAPSSGPTPEQRQTVLDRAAATRSQGNGRVHLLVQLHAVPDRIQRLELASKGLVLGEWASGTAYVAAIEPSRAAQALDLPQIRWYGLWSADLKIHPRLAAGDLASWTRDPERPGHVMVFAQLHREVPLSEGSRIAEDAGGVAMEPVVGLHGLTMWVPEERVLDLARIEDILWLEEGPPPLTPTNDGVRSRMNADQLYEIPYDLDGSGVRLFVFDGGSVRETHETFDDGGGSRVTDIDASGNSHHPTHVAGTAAGDGSGSDGDRGRGVAPGASVLSAGYEQIAGTILFWDNAGDIENDYGTARNSFDADLGTNSIGSNTASNDYPCELMGDYGVSSSLIDGIVRGDNVTVGSPVAMTWSAGNERGGGTMSPGRCGSNYETTSPPSCAKNPIHVGAINSDGASMTAFSSWGPCDDGRLKPLLVAAGCETGAVTGEDYIYSAVNFDNSSYAGICGTSMSTPGVAGGLALFLQEWRNEGHGGATDRPLPALLKAMAIHTATDLGMDGPDYIYGYGNFDVQAMVDVLRNDNGTLDGSSDAEWGVGSVNHGFDDEFSVVVGPGMGSLRASLAWDDAAAAAFTVDALVNDLDLEVVSPSQVVHRPWVLDPASPDQPATREMNIRDNQEQVVIANPETGTWVVRVRGTSVPEGPQTYGLAYSVAPAVIDPSSCLTVAATFEADNDDFVLDGALRVAAPAPGHGSFSLLFGDAIDTIHEAYVEISVPPGSVSADLSFAWYMTTEEWSFGHPWDYFTAEVRDTAGSVLAVVDLRSDGWTQGSWLQMEHIDLTPWAGQTIRLAFRGTNDIASTTAFFLDDVTVTSCMSPLIFADGFESGDISAWSAP